MTDVRRLTFLGLIVLWGCAPSQPVSPGAAQRTPTPATTQAKAEPAKTESAKGEPVGAEPTKTEPASTSVATATQAEKRGRETTAAPSEPFRFAETDSGQLLAGFLIPERQPLPPLAIPTSPKPGRPMLLETLGFGLYRTPLEVAAAPKGLLPPGPQRPITVPGEVPPLAAVGLPALPAPVTVPAAGRLYAPSPAAAPVTSASAPAGQGDPTAEAARGALLREPVAGRSTPAGPLPLEIANPFQASRDAALRRPPAEAPVAAGEGTRPRVNLPAPTPVK